MLMRTADVHDLQLPVPRDKGVNDFNYFLSIFHVVHTVRRFRRLSQINKSIYNLFHLCNLWICVNISSEAGLLPAYPEAVLRRFLFLILIPENLMISHL